jgi:hypothetical protein
MGEGKHCRKGQGELSWGDLTVYIESLAYPLAGAAARCILATIDMLSAIKAGEYPLAEFPLLSKQRKHMTEQSR